MTTQTPYERTGTAPLRILFLDDVRTPNTIGLEHREGVTHIDVVRSCDEAIAAVSANPRYDLWYLDHDLGLRLIENPDHDPSLITCAEELPHAPTGMDFLRWAEQYARGKWPWGRVLVHSANPVGRDNMRALIIAVERDHYGIRRGS